MPSEFPPSPKLLKGALVEFSERFIGPVPNVIVFQYNPETLTRTLEPWQPPRRQARTDEEEGGEEHGPSTAQPEDPPESFSLDLELDAADALEETKNNPLTAVTGVADRIAAMEMLLYPSEQSLLGGLRGSESEVQRAAAEAPSDSSASEGEADTLPRGSVPIVLFVWGPGRVVPVRLTSFQVQEQIYSPTLYPIQAKVSIGLRVLTPAELENHWDTTNKELAIAAYAFTKKQKQALALAYQAKNVESILGMLPF